LIFLGLAVAYVVGKKKIGEIFKRYRGLANGLSKGADQGISTARPIPSKISSRRHKSEDEESRGSPNE
jgi:hypothetical protein